MADCIPVNTPVRYDAAMEEIEALMMVERRTAGQNDRLEVLAVCIESYESRVYTYRLPLAHEAIQFRMDEGRLCSRDVARKVGGPARLARILAGATQLTVEDVRVFHNTYGVPLAPLVFGGEDRRWVHG